MNEVVAVERAEAYFKRKIEANPRGVYGRLMRSVIRATVRRDLALALFECEQAILLEPENPWAFCCVGKSKGSKATRKARLPTLNKRFD